MNLTIAYTTARKNPKWEWFFDSLALQVNSDDHIEVIVCDLLRNERVITEDYPFLIRHIEPKPTIWQGKHRIVRDQWWAKSNSLNTCICSASYPWFASVDDRSVILPGWLNSIRDAIRGDYAVAGTYQKRTGMEVEKGIVKSPGICVGADSRMVNAGREPMQTFGDYWFGCNNAAKLECFLEIGGYPEDVCDSLGYEDVIMGHLLIRNGFVTKFDSRMKILEDRTQIDEESLVKRSDFGQSPNDKSHAVETRTGGHKTSLNSFDIRAVRNSVQNGLGFPLPSASHVDWFDSADIPTKFNAL